MTQVSRCHQLSSSIGYHNISTRAKIGNTRQCLMPTVTGGFPKIIQADFQEIIITFKIYVWFKWKLQENKQKPASKKIIRQW